jgi:5-methylthioadenosine/S-adenosylhomocysteine deaminase
MGGHGGGRELNAMRTLIHNACVLTVDPHRRVLDRGYVVIDGRTIDEVGPAERRPGGPFDRVIDARGMVLTPGLINMHQHLHMNLLKGLADGLLLEPWVFTLSTPFRAHVDEEALRLATTLGALEMLRTGTTCVLNHQAPFDVRDYRQRVIGWMGEVGIRQMLAVAFQCRTPKLPQHPHSAEEARELLAAFIEQHDGACDGLTRLAMVIECNAHHTELGRSSDELVRVGHALALEKNLRVAVHMSGGTLSMSMGFTKYRRQTGRSDVEYLERLGVLDARWILKHGIHFSDGDMLTVQRRAASVVYTPTSEAIRGGGIGPFGRMQRMGINCALGSDGPAVDYSVDMVEQMRACCMLQGVRYRDAGAIEPHAALEMATINAARALGLEREIGSIEPGKLADLVLFDLSRPPQQLVLDPVRRLIFTGRGSDAHSVFVQGTQRLEDGRFTRFAGLDELLSQAQAKARLAVAAVGLAGRARPNWPRLVGAESS